MKKLSRVLLVTAGAILGLFAAALLAVNLYVQSQGTQAWIQEELAQRLGTTLRINRISVTPWSGLKLTGITMPQEPGSVPGDFLRAETFRLRIRFLSLFARRLVITEVALVRPNVVWAQNASGKWRLPATAPHVVTNKNVSPDEPSVAPTTLPPATVPAPASSAPPPPVIAGSAPAAGPAVPQEEHVNGDGFTPEVRRVMLTNGNFRFLDAQAKPVASFERVNFRSNFRSGSALRGNASIGKISLRERFFLEQLESILRYDSVSLELSQISARCAEGEVNGQFKINPADPGSPFDVTVKFHDVQADRVVTDAGGPSGMISGRIEGQLEASGKTSDADALAGMGEIYLRDGEVRQYSLLTALGELLQIDELKQLRFERAQVKYHIRPGVITVDELLLTSAHVRLSANGTISFAGKLHLDSQLAINEKIRSHLFSAIRDNFQPIEPAGFSAVNFQVSGSVDRPKTNLMDRLVGGELKDIGGLIDTFFGNSKANRAKKSKATDEPSQSQQPASEGTPAEVPPVPPDQIAAPAETASPALAPTTPSP